MPDLRIKCSLSIPLTAKGKALSLAVSALFRREAIGHVRQKLFNFYAFGPPCVCTIKHH
jgi:hypothetical protein